MKSPIFLLLLRFSIRESYYPCGKCTADGKEVEKVEISARVLESNEGEM